MQTTTAEARAVDIIALWLADPGRPSADTASAARDLLANLAARGITVAARDVEPSRPATREALATDSN